MELHLILAFCVYRKTSVSFRRKRTRTRSLPPRRDRPSTTSSSDPPRPRPKWTRNTQPFIPPRREDPAQNHCDLSLLAMSSLYCCVQIQESTFVLESVVSLFILLFFILYYISHQQIHISLVKNYYYKEATHVDSDCFCSLLTACFICKIHHDFHLHSICKMFSPCCKRLEISSVHDHRSILTWCT